ncbi:ABC transporter ATP-binding protein [Anaerotruncus rubiinfantis]|uniref:ABC transporter ATP-binding protein n=1 Tax=Anaerotruncus rubiinfantis TaxID=1720200 RepID=UPI00082C0C4F|nr:energy-coupling factor transporter ATPase [Anaerotruncus rubiinfantis]
MGNELIRFDHVSYTYPGVDTPAVRDVSLSINEGEIVLITGPSGAGKTTLCSMLNRMIPESYGGEVKGTVSIKGADLSEYSVGQMAFISGMLFQDPSGQLTCPTVGDEIAFGPENRGLPVEEINALIDRYIGYVNMRHLIDRPPQALSGGQQQSVAYAAVLAMEPEIYILDEPTSNLDPLGSDLVFSLIKKVTGDKNKTAIIVEHKLEKIIDMVDRLVVMDKGRIVFDGKPEQVLTHYRELMEIGVAAPQIIQVFNRLKDAGKADLALTTNLAKAVAELSGALPGKLPQERLDTVGEGFPEPARYEKPVIEVRGLRFGYNSEVEVLHGIDMDIYEGEFLSIVGQNGSGKTTIVKHFNGLLKPTGGSVKVFGTETRDTTVAGLSQKVGYCFQNPDHQIFSSVVRDEICYGPKNLGWPQEKIDKTVGEVGKMLHIDDLFDQNPYNLSKGQRQQIAVAAILAMEPDVLIVDEPTTGQDPRQSHEMMDMVKWLNKELHKTIVVITHDMSIAAEYSDRIIVMHNGTVIAQGSPRDVFAQEKLLNSSNLESPQVTRLLQQAGITSPTAINVEEAMQLLSELTFETAGVHA